MKCLLLWALLGAPALAATGAPSLQQIEAARQALIDCRLADPAALLDASQMAWLNDLRLLALHAPDVEESLAPTEIAVIGELRRANRFELSDVYAAACAVNRTSGLRSGLVRMRAADPVVVRDAAWVPLLTGGGEYLGVGLSFQRQAGAWRWGAWEMKVLARTADSHFLSLQLGTLPDLDEEAYRAKCGAGIRSAPEPDAGWENRLSDGSDAFDDPSNALGAAQRLAALRLAEGRSQPPSATARVILAEIILRSLDFANAPRAGSTQWRQRVERAERLLADARRAPVDWLRMAPLLAWLAQAHESPASGLPFDPKLANTYRNLAASSNNPGVLEMIAEARQWRANLPGENFQFEMPRSPIACVEAD